MKMKMENLEQIDRCKKVLNWTSNCNQLNSLTLFQILQHKTYRDESQGEILNFSSDIYRLFSEALNNKTESKIN